MSDQIITENMRKAHAIVESEHSYGAPNTETRTWLLMKENNKDDVAYLVEMLATFGQTSACADAFRDDTEDAMLPQFESVSLFQRDLVTCLLARVDWRYIVNYVAESYADAIAKLKQENAS